MDLSVFDLESAIEYEIFESSNCEYKPTKNDIKNSIENNYFPELKYFYSKYSFFDLINDLKFNGKELNKILNKYSENEFKIDLNNQIIVKIKNEEKNPKNFTELNNFLKNNKYRLEKIIDVEFFEYFKIHRDYLNNLNGKFDEEIEYLKKLEEYNELKNNELGYNNFGNNENIKKLKELNKYIINRYNLIKYFNEMNINSFNSIFFNEDPTRIINILDENYKINKNAFSTFMDTEKIHLQFGLISKGNKKNIPILLYFGYGNYYPFTKNFKDKRERFERFSMINKNDNFNLKYIEKEFNIKKETKLLNLLEKIDYCQQNYFKYFNEKFNLKQRKKKYEEKYGKSEFSRFQDEIMMINPIIRTKSSAIVSKLYFENNSVLFK